VTRLKIDENLPDVVSKLLQYAGHDAATAREEGLAGAPDDTLLATAKSEGRVLVTLDHDFANVRRYDPAGTAGIIVLRLRDQTLPMIRRAVVRLADLLAREATAGRLWILDESRLRIWPGATDAE
jgi:predicted nuclease of predicted toxin-antitoxin system